ncbi:aminotransferase class III-fold pyridoxal phosphate-dependent enzyme [bacterium]|nr:aminotransferase class III-fold pyridoxal phosphate-dependent enzyme [bacterium]
MKSTVRSTQSTLDLLARYESRNVVYRDPDGTWPIVWERAFGVHIWDAEGKRYLDLTAAFGVAAAGHANRKVVRAGQKQMARLLHAMGDVHPHALKAELARELSRVTFERWTRRRLSAKTIFCNSGFEAVEAALKTARLATGRRGVIAFRGGYHGLGYGTLNATHREHFRKPFCDQLGEFGSFADFPKNERELRKLKQELPKMFRRTKPGAVLVEPIQARGGINIPPDGFLPLLRTLCDRHNALLIVDEIYTGFGRTGKWFAVEQSGVVPDLICLGKALTGGFPLSACVGRADLMDRAWPPSEGEAIHTSTFLGHPVGCAMALAQTREIKRQRLVQRSAAAGTWLRRELNRLVASLPRRNWEMNVCGSGLMIGLEIVNENNVPATDASLAVIKLMLRRGFILLPEGEHGNVISFTPPLTVTKPQLQTMLKALRQTLEEVLDR